MKIVCEDAEIIKGEFSKNFCENTSGCTMTCKIRLE